MGPARFEDVLTIAVEVLEIGESSIRYGFHLRSTMGPIAKRANGCRVLPKDSRQFWYGKDL